MGFDDLAENSNEEFKINHASKLFIDRNRAFRVIYDTVILTTDLTGGISTFDILCENLVKISNAESAALASVDQNSKILKLKSLYSGLNRINIENTPDEDLTSKIQDDFIELCKAEEGLVLCSHSPHCITTLLPKSILKSISCKNSRECYRIVCEYEGKIIAVAMLQMPEGEALKLKDMVETYIRMMTIIIQRINTERDLQASNNRFKTLLDSSPMGIMVINSQERVVEINNEALKILDRKREELIGTSCRSFVCVADNECPIKNVGELHKEERFIIRSDGIMIPIIKSVTKVQMDGELFYIETFIDITEQKRNVEELERAKKEAEDSAIKLSENNIYLSFAKEEAMLANQAKTEFLASLSQEIRTPLQCLIGFSEAILDESSIENTKEYARKILSESNQLTSLVENLLDTAKTNNSKINLDRIEVYGEIESINDKNISTKELQLSEDQDAPVSRKAKILLVEDHLPNQEIVVLHIKDLGHIVSVAKNGIEAVDLCYRDGFDIILMDLQMPGMDGFDATKLIRSSDNKAKNIPIIGVTANANQETKDKCFEIGMNDVITKPVRKQVLMKTINRWLEYITNEGNDDCLQSNNNQKPVNELFDEKYVFDKNYIFEEFSNDINSIKLALSKFQNIIEKQFIVIKKALEKEDFDAISKEMHKIKGASSNLSALKLSSIASMIEDSINQGNPNSDRIRIDLLSMEQAYTELKDVIRQHIFI